MFFDMDTVIGQAILGRLCLLTQMLVVFSNPGPVTFVVTDVDTSQVILGELHLLTQVSTLAE
jgi:Flp pilus assembly protein TadB